MKLFSAADSKMRQASRESAFLSQFPRHVLEMVGVSIIAPLAFFMAKNSCGDSNPVLRAVALETTFASGESSLHQLV